MANEYARNIQDSAVNPTATITLPSAASLSTTSAAIDLGADVQKPETIELDLSVPSLTSAMSPSTNTAGVTYLWESSTTSAFSAVARTIVSKNIAGSTGGTALTSLRTRVPSDCERYVRAKVTLGATASDSSTLAATASVRF